MGSAVEWRRLVNAGSDPFAGSNVKLGARTGGAHRTDGPAVIRADGSREFWVAGERLDGFAEAVARRAYQRRRAAEEAALGSSDA